MEEHKESFKEFFEANHMAFLAGQKFEREEIKKLLELQSDSILFSKSVVLNMINQREGQ